MNEPAHFEHIRQVKCGVKNCAYNQQEQCTADEIQVAPHHACCAGDTSCATFKLAKD